LSLSLGDVAQFEDYRIPFGLLLNRELSRSFDVAG
jgi:hypothetical protein